MSKRPGKSRFSRRTLWRWMQAWAWANALVVFAAMGYTFAEARRVGLPTSEGGWVALFVGLGALVAYLLDRVFDPPSQGARAAFVNRFKALSFVVAGLAMAGGVWVFLKKMPPRAEWVLVAAGVVSAGYVLPCWPSFKAKRWRRLRDIPYAKAFWVALAWALATSLAPALAAGASWRVAGDWAISRFLFILAAAVAFDVRDLKRDRQDGVRTVPMAVGVWGTKLICWGLLGLFAWYAIDEHARSAIALALVGPAVGLALWLTVLSKKKTEAYYSLGIDGWLALQAGLLWLAVVL